MRTSTADARDWIPAGVSVLLLSVLAAGCQPREGRVQGVTVTDSGGVAVVRHDAASVRSAPHISLVEELRLGTMEGPEETQFFRISAADVSGDELYILDGGHSQVRVFRSDGTFRRSFGREGEGPGEFQRPSSLDVLGDTVVVQGRRLTLLDTEGSLLATGPGQVFGEDGYRTRAVPTPAGWLTEWYSRKAGTMERNVPFRETIEVRPVEPISGELGEAVFQYEMAEMRLAGEIGFYIGPFYQASPTHALGSDGRIYWTPGDAYRIDVRDGRDGHLIRRIEADFTAPAVTDAMVDEAIDYERERVADAPPGSEGEMYEAVIGARAALPVPDTRPLFGRMYASPSGRLLALRLDLDPDPLRSGDPSTWELFDVRGVLEGRITLQGGTNVLRLLDDALLVVEQDDLGVQTFVKYGLDGGAAEAPAPGGS